MRAERILVALLAATLMLGPVQAQEPAAPPFLSAMYPAPEATINTTTPTIRADFTGLDVGFVLSTLRVVVDGVTVTDLEDEFFANETGFEYQVPSPFALKDGRHRVNVSLTANDRIEHAFGWNFTVDTKPPVAPSSSWTPTQWNLAAIGFLGVAGLAVGGYVASVRVRKPFAIERFFLEHPKQRQMLPVYGSLYLAAWAVLGINLWLLNVPTRPAFATEYLVLTALLVALGPYAVDLQRRRRLLRAYETSYAHFLFELGDALRGGIDPMKAVQELAKTDDGVLAPHLRVAADGLRLGRPFDAVLRNMAKPLGSHLIGRYAALVGEAAKVGGEVSTVVHRAARDMEELVKIGVERNRQLLTPMMTMYIAFAVLLWMVKSLMDFAPDLISTDFQAGGLFAASDGPPVARMDLATLQQRFFHLTMIASGGTGILIGAFTEGKLRYGLHHAFFMLVSAALFFQFMVL